MSTEANNLIKEEARWVFCLALYNWKELGASESALTSIAQGMKWHFSEVEVRDLILYLQELGYCKVESLPMTGKLWAIRTAKLIDLVEFNADCLRALLDLRKSIGDAMLKSSYSRLPPEAQAGIDKILREGRFANYSELTEKVNGYLAEQGFEVEFKRSTLHRHGQKLQEIIENVKQSHEAAVYVMEAFPEDQEKISQATIRLVQDRLFTMLLECGENQIGSRELSAIGRAVADITRANIGERKYQQEVRAKAELAAKAIAATASKGGLSAKTIALIEEQILGIAK